MATPLVSVICLCYNHERFVAESIHSVFAQTYPNLEVILVDDQSTDNSRRVISGLLERYPSMKYLPLERNAGNCTAFNRGFALSSGAYIVDFSADDVLLPDRLTKQVALFETLDQSFGVVFTDVEYMDENGKPLYTHVENLCRRKLIASVPEGDIYKDLIQSYFVSSPSMLVRREVFQKLQGYDETLAYEDFDFFIRSSRYYRYAFLNEVLTRVRKVSHSLSARAYRRGDRQLHSTYVVCRKARQMNRSDEENRALITRVRYELRHAVLSENYGEAELFLELLKELTPLNSWDNLLRSLLKMKVPLARLRRIYHGLRYQ